MSLIENNYTYKTHLIQAESDELMREIHAFRSSRDQGSVVT